MGGGRRGRGRGICGELVPFPAAGLKERDGWWSAWKGQRDLWRTSSIPSRSATCSIGRSRSCCIDCLSIIFLSRIRELENFSFLTSITVNCPLMFFFKNLRIGEFFFFNVNYR